VDGAAGSGLTPKTALTLAHAQATFTLAHLLVFTDGSVDMFEEFNAQRDGALFTETKKHSPNNGARAE